MTVLRALAGNLPSTGEMGFWISKPGIDVQSADRSSRAQMNFSTNFAGRKALKIIAAGLVYTNTNIALPGSLSDLGGDPILVFRPMVTSAQERQNSYYAVANGSDTLTGSEFFNRLFDGNPAYFKIYNQTNVNSQGYLVRYLVFLV